MTLTIPSEPKFYTSTTFVALDRENSQITFWRNLDSTVRTIVLPCTDDELAEKLERTRRMKDSDFSWMSTL